MSSINQKLGIRPGGKRSMMKLPRDRAAAVALTSAVCPSCGRRGARESRLVDNAYWCPSCNHTWSTAEASDR